MCRFYLFNVPFYRFVFFHFLSSSFLPAFSHPRSNLTIDMHQLDLWHLLGKCTLMCFNAFEKKPLAFLMC